MFPCLVIFSFIKTVRIWKPPILGNMNCTHVRMVYSLKFGKIRPHCWLLKARYLFLCCIMCSEHRKLIFGAFLTPFFWPRIDQIPYIGQKLKNTISPRYGKTASQKSLRWKISKYFFIFYHKKLKKTGGRQVFGLGRDFSQFSVLGRFGPKKIWISKIFFSWIH